MYAYWVCAARETPIFSPEFPFRSISFSQNNYQKIHSGASPFYIFLADFAVPETIIFKISLISTRSSPPTGRLSPNCKAFGSAGLAAGRRAPARRVLAVPETRIFTLKTDQARSGAPRIFKLKTAQARSGAPHFHPRPGARSGARAHFSLCRGTYLPKFGSPPPPTPGQKSMTCARIAHPERESRSPLSKDGVQCRVRL